MQIDVNNTPHPTMCTKKILIHVQMSQTVDSRGLN